jgi:two-component system sensor kinase FixL
MLPPTLAGPVSARCPDASEILQALLDTTPDGVVMFDGQGRIECFNRAAERLFDYVEPEVLGRDIGSLLAGTDHGAHASEVARGRRTTDAARGASREAVARRRDGTTFPVGLSIGRIGTVDPPHFVGFIHDATLMDQVRRAHERISHVSRLTMLGEMVSGIAHELNQPLAAIAAYAQASGRLLRDDTAHIAEVRDALGQIATQALRAGEVIARLRSLARPPPARRGPFDLNEAVHEIMPLISADARQHDVEVVVDLAPRSLLLDQDREQIQQVLLNLLHNAIEALAQEPSDTRRVSITTGLTAEQHVQLWVCDNGPGVDPWIAERMFHPFCTTKATGTGLGLAISRTIAQAHGGRLEHVPDSEVRGAKFRLTLPALEGVPS